MRLWGLFPLCAAVLWARSSGIQGVVTDPSAAPIPAVKVTVTNVATGVSVTTTTNDSGSYKAPFQPPGVYRITAGKSGFSTVSRDNLTLNVDQIARVDLNLKIGAVAETMFALKYGF
jgi:hypothetical protein